LLTCSAKEGIPNEICKIRPISENLPDAAKYINILIDKYCFQKEYAEWVIKLWDSVFTRYENEHLKKEKNKEQIDFSKENNQSKERSEVYKTGKIDLNTKEIEAILKEEINSLTEKIKNIESENKFTTNFLFKFSSITIFIIIIQLISVPIMFPMDYIWQTIFFNPYEFINPIKYIVTFLTIIANIILLSAIISYRNKVTKLE
jgi:hypothetical protein